MVHERMSSAESSYHEDSKLMLPPTSTAKWTKKDILLITVGSFIKFGDAAEIYLPGVMTQMISCELGLSSTQEGILGMILFLFLAVSCLISVPLVNLMGERRTILLSMYLSILCSCFCAGVPTFYNLVIARALIGLCVGLNSSTIGVFIRNRVSSEDNITPSMFIHGSVTFPLGAAYVSIIGYFLLDLLGWRFFLLVVSLPLFIPPIVMLHFSFQDDTSTERTYVEFNEGQNYREVHNFKVRAIKLCIFQGFSKLAGYGSILLLPALIRRYKILDSLQSDEKCLQVVRGPDFLILAAVTGGAAFLGRPLCYYLRKTCKFTWLQSFGAVSMGLCYGLILANPGKVAESVLLWVAMLGFSMQETEAWLLMLEPQYFGGRVTLGVAVVIASGYVGGAIGVTFVGFMDPLLATSVIVCVCLVQALLIFTMADGTDN